jgi:hypothetical protein
MTRHPPRLAEWLLRRLYAGPNLESVVGDLFERYQAAPSPGWYWRQVATTVAASVGWTWRAHPVPAIGAGAIGCAATWLLGQGLVFAAASPLGRLAEIASGESRHIVFAVWAPLVTCAGAAWIVARLDPPRRSAMVSAYALLFFVLAAPEFQRRLVNAMADPRYLAAFFEYLVTRKLAAIGMLVGGFLLPVRDVTTPIRPSTP